MDRRLLTHDLDGQMYDPRDAPKYIERLRTMATQFEEDAAALRYALEVLDGDPVSSSPLPPRGDDQEGTDP